MTAKASIIRTLFAGLSGGAMLNIVMVLTFRLLGFGWDGGGILISHSTQSPKLIAIWTELEPIPLVVSKPAPIVIGLILFGIGHAFLYRWLAPAWPQGTIARTLRLSMLVFFLSFLFWEFFTPFNLFGEPLPLIGLELVFWATIAFAEAFVIALVLEWKTMK
jgi:hypothetical protein